VLAARVFWLAAQSALEMSEAIVIPCQSTLIAAAAFPLQARLTKPQPFVLDDCAAKGMSYEA
jgi:hypothetical protein